MGKDILESAWPSIMGLSGPHSHSIPGEVLTYQAVLASLEEGRDRGGRDRVQAVSGSPIPPPVDRVTEEAKLPQGQEVA